MRIKSDFITNSSSSSFVIAFKKDIKILDIKKAIMANVKNMIESGNSWDVDWLYEELNIEKGSELILGMIDSGDSWDDNLPYNKAFNLEDVALYIAGRIYDELHYSALDLDGWQVIGREYGSEEGFDGFMYSYFSPTGNKIKCKTYS